MQTMTPAELDAWDKKVQKNFRRIKRLKKEFNYKVINPKCCFTCGNAQWGYEREIDCSIMEDSEIDEDTCQELGVCDKWEAIKK